MFTLVTGGTGFIGRYLLPHLARPLVVSRSKSAECSGERLIWPDPQREPLVIPSQYSVESIVHLMGEPIDAHRWTAAQKSRIRDSRVRSTENLVRGIERMNPRPRTLVSASAMGYYGDRGDEILSESAGPGEGFLAETCVAWEAAARAATELGLRVVSLRISLVLGSGGALAKMLPVFRSGLGGQLGDGRQWMSWIHAQDLARLIAFCVQHSTISGPVNICTPNPVRNADWTAALAKRLNRPALIPVPRWALRLRYGEFADSLFDSVRMNPVAALQSGFEFQFPTLEGVLADLIP